jgi:hypothetical protein
MRIPQLPRPFLCLVVATAIGGACYYPGSSRADASGGYVPRTGFVTLQFDDSNDLHYSQVFPLLTQHGFKGTFGYITCGSALGIDHEAWKMQEIYAAGHEVQDHTTYHDYVWATHVDTLDDGVKDWIEWTFVDSTVWDSLCQRSLFILDSLGIDVCGWNYPGGGTLSVPGHPTWRWLGAENDTLYRVIGRRYPYAMGYSVPPHTAHLNLRGHNRPDRWPYFSVPHVTFDYRSVDEVKTGIADAVASGLWYLAVGHVRTMAEVEKLDSILDWLDETDVEVLKCVDGWQRIEFGVPDPSENQLPQARMLDDLDGNNIPDGFTGCCTWDTVSVPPVADVGCLSATGEVRFYSYGPEVGTNCFSMWVKTVPSRPETLRLVVVEAGFEWDILSETWVTVAASPYWTKIDTSYNSKLLMETEDEVDRVLFILNVSEGDTVLMAHPEFMHLDLAAVGPSGERPSADRAWRISPNPVRRGMAFRIESGELVNLYDVLGRRVGRYIGGDPPTPITVDTSELPQGVYFIEVPRVPGGRAKVIVY